MVDQDENESGNPGHIHPGASALLSGGVFLEKEVSRGEGSLPLRLTDSSEHNKKRDGKIDPEQEGAALDVRSAANKKRSFSAR